MAPEGVLRLHRMTELIRLWCAKGGRLVRLC